MSGCDPYSQLVLVCNGMRKSSNWKWADVKLDSAFLERIF